MNSNWKAGDKALCIAPFIGRDAGSHRPLDGDHPVLGVTYLVTGTRPGRVSGRIGLFLAGMKSTNPRTGNDCTYVAHKFRKVVPACDRNAQEQEGLIPHEGFWQGRPDL